jgi:hypothetical protein
MKTNTYRYNWPEEIWALHLEVTSPLDVKSEILIEYLGSGAEEILPIPPQETMRYNICRYDDNNTSITLQVPEKVTLQLFENLDRAFYTDIPVTEDRLYLV